MEPIDRHQQEILANKESWERKPILRRIYAEFHRRIAAALPANLEGKVVELGSGVADISAVIPGCLRTDLFPNPWIDRTENAYQLSFADGTVSSLILFDVFHHLRYPGRALQEFSRVLIRGGRVIIFDPGMSLLGRMVYGPLHPEPLGFRERITWDSPDHWTPEMIDYYAAQSNAHRLFVRREVDLSQLGWKIIEVKRYADISYVLSGGYSRKQLYPDGLYPLMRAADQLCGILPAIFSTRILAVIQKV